VATRQPTDQQVSETLSRIWTEVLRVVPEYDDDFFELGGDSLAMVNVLFLVEERFGTELSVEELFAESFTFGAGISAITQALAGDRT
jgi:acyl carrier protein